MCVSFMVICELACNLHFCALNVWVCVLHTCMSICSVHVCESVKPEVILKGTLEIKAMPLFCNGA